MGDDKIKNLNLKISKPTDFMPSDGKNGTSQRFLAVNLLGLRRFE